MHIAIIGLGGVTHTFRQWPERVIGERLVQTGHHVVAYGYHDPRSPHLRVRQEVIAGIQVRRVTPRFWPSRSLRQAMAREVVPDLAHIFHPRNVLAYSAVRLLRRWHVPIVYTWLGPFHDAFLVDDRESPYDTTPHYDRLIFEGRQVWQHTLQDGHLREHLRNYWLHWPLKQAHLYLACSEHEAEVLGHMGIPQERIRVVPLWIETAPIDAVPEQAPPAVPGRPLILLIGQLIRRKGADLVVEALPQILARYPQAAVAVVSHNPAGWPALQARARALGVASHLHFLGQVSEEEKIALLRHCDVYVLPSRYEGFGLPLLEAMACGAPLVSSDIPVIREIVRDGENGLLVPRDDSAALARAILRLLDDPALRERLVQGGKRTLEERYNGATCVQQLLEAYQEAVALARREHGRDG